MHETTPPPDDHSITALQRWLSLCDSACASAGLERLLDLDELSCRIMAIQDDRDELLGKLRSSMRADYREHLVRRSLKEYLTRLRSPQDDEPAIATMDELLELTGYANKNGLYQAIGRGKMKFDKVLLVIDTFEHRLPFPYKDRLKCFAAKSLPRLIDADPAVAIAPRISIDRYLVDWLGNIQDWWVLRSTEAIPTAAASKQHERISGFVREDRARGYLYDGEDWDQELDNALFNDPFALDAFYWYWQPAYTVWCQEFSAGGLL